MSSSSYPNAFCVKCGTHTETQSKHTVLLANQARALRGVCPKCANEVYKILPKARRTPASASDKARFPDAFCVKCKKHTPTLNQSTVILDNKSRAMTGQCSDCHSEVYRIIGAAKPEMAPTKVAAPLANPSPKKEAQGPILARALSVAPQPAFRDQERRMTVSKTESSTGQWAYFVAAGIIVGTIVAVLAYSAW